MSLIQSNIFKIFQSTVFGIVFEKWHFSRYDTVWYCLILVTTTIRENHCMRILKLKSKIGDFFLSYTAKPVGSACLCNALYRDTCNALHRYKKAWHKSIHRATHFPRHFSSHRDIVTSRHRYIDRDIDTSLHRDIVTS